jgi:hypothetical protein
LWEAVLILAGRFYRSPDAPFGVVGSIDLGVAYVRTRHPDVYSLLRGHRGMGVPVDQSWPTVDQVAGSVLNVGFDVLPSEKQNLLQSALDAAIEWISEWCETGIGVA